MFFCVILSINLITIETCLTSFFPNTNAIKMQDVDASEESLINFPCIAPSSTYTPPPSHSLSAVIGTIGTQSLRRSSSSVLKKSYTSDDELDELDSPLSSILTDGSRVSPSSKGSQWVPKGGRSIARYQLLREVWKDGE